MNYIAVIDTNVIVSSFLNHDSYPGKIIDMVYGGEICPVLNQDIIYEYIDVLTRKKFNINKSSISKTINGLINSCIFAERTKSNEYFIDEDDAVFYEVTLSARKESNAHLITGNKKHFTLKPFVVNPKEMYEIIKQSSSN